MQIQLYDAKGQDRTLNAKDLVTLKIAHDNLLWINGTPKQIAKGTYPKEIAAALAQAERAMTSVRIHDDFYCFAVPVAGDHNAAKTGLLTMILGEDWLVTEGEDQAIEFGDFLDHDVGDTMKGKLSGSTLAAALLTENFARIHRNVESIDREIDRLEERILITREGRNTLQVMAVLRRQVSRLRELLAGYRPVIHALIRPDFLPELTEDDRRHFLNLQSSFERLEDEVARVRESVVNSYDLYSTRIALNTNRLLRTLTFVTIGIGLIGALAGIFGMNFKAPVFETGQHGFVVLTTIMVLIALITTGAALFSFRRP